MNNTIPRKNGQFCYLTSLALLGGAALAAACSDPAFKSGEPKGTGGVSENAGGARTDGGDEETGGRATGGTGGASTGGSGGEGTDDGGVGEASAGGTSGTGDSGTDVGPECVRDSDCVALTCNGEPRCNDDGKCEPGLPCENPDPEHCSVSCVRTGGQASCQPQGLDADGDGHFDAVCASGGGYDCDDKSPTTYAGAAEQCDGVDNDCDGLADVEDGLPLAGMPTLIDEVTGTATLGMAASVEGFGVLELARVTAPGSATSARAVFVEHGGKKVVSPLQGNFIAETSIGYAQGKFHIFETHGLPTEPANVLKLGWPEGGASGGWSTYTPPDQIPQNHVTGRAFPAFPFEPFALYTTQATSTSKASLSIVELMNGATPVPLYRVDAPAELFRPAVSSRGFAWVQSSGPTNAFHQLTVQFMTSMADGKLSRPTILQALDVEYDGTIKTSARHEALRPQVIAAGSTYLVGWLSDAGLQFARLSQKGEEICRSGPVPSITFWGWNNSMVASHDLTLVREDAYVVAVTSDRVPVILRIDGACRAGSPIPLGDPGAKVALGPALAAGGKAFLEVGHPVIASYLGFQESNFGVAWLEDPRANGLYRVMLRKFRTKLCN